MSRPIVIRTVEIIYPSGKCPCHHPEAPPVMDQSARYAEFLKETRALALASHRRGAVECVTLPEPEHSPPTPTRQSSESSIEFSRSSRRRPWGWVLRGDSQ